MSHAVFFSPAGQPISRDGKSGRPPCDQLPLRGVSRNACRSHGAWPPRVVRLRHGPAGYERPADPLGDVAGLMSPVGGLSAVLAPTKEARERFSIKMIAWLKERFFVELTKDHGRILSWSNLSAYDKLCGRHPNLRPPCRLHRTLFLPERLSVARAARRDDH